MTETITHPTTEIETRLAAELNLLPRQFIPRAAPFWRLFQDWITDNSHVNSFLYSRDYDPNAEFISGWLIKPELYVHHSVVMVDGALMCITPLDTLSPYIEFIPDSEVEMIFAGKLASPIRRGAVVPSSVRRT